MDLFSVLTRGSQFRVEAVLARVARVRNFLLLTGTRRTLKSQPPLLEQPFIKEPKSGAFRGRWVCTHFLNRGADDARTHT